MPDTVPDNDASPSASPGSCGVMEGYRSARIGKLAAARARASARIKAIVKANPVEATAGAGGFAEFLEAVEEAVAENGLAIFQTTQDRGRDGTFLITTLAHESDQWICAEIRMRCAYSGPEAFGAEKSHLRRHAVLAALALAAGPDPDGPAG